MTSFIPDRIVPFRTNVTSCPCHSFSTTSTCLTLAQSLPGAGTPAHND